MVDIPSPHETISSSRAGNLTVLMLTIPGMEEALEKYLLDK